MTYFRFITSQRTVIVSLLLLVPLVISNIKNTKFWVRISDLNRLAFFMNIAFGLSLLMVSIAFVTGNYIGEDNRFVNVVEILISIALIVLGINRIRNYNSTK